MMGFGHALSGVTVGLATAPLVPGPLPHQAAWVATVTGCTLLPDLDQERSTASYMWGPVSGVLSSIVGTLSGGHRAGTHSLLGIAGAFGAVWAAGLTVPTTAIVAGLVAGLALSSVCVLVPGKGWASWWPVNLCTALLAALTALLAGLEMPAWAPYAVALGVAVHIAGDMLTKAGCPLLWPLSDARLSLLPYRWAKAGGPHETWLCVGFGLVIAWTLFSWLPIAA